MTDLLDAAPSPDLQWKKSGSIVWCSEEARLTKAIHVRLLAKALYDMIDQAEPDRRPGRVRLDFTRCGFATETFMLPVLPLLDRYRDDYGTDFIVDLPQYNESAATLFVNANWAHYIDPDRYEENALAFEGGHIPATGFAVRRNDGAIDTAHNATLRRRLIDLLVRASELDANVFDAIDNALLELMDNVANHAYDYTHYMQGEARAPNIGGYFQATYLQGLHAVEFVLADGGMGIPNSLKSGSMLNWQRQDYSDEDLLLESIKAGTTRDQSKGQGNGLHLTQQLAIRSGGKFELNSGWGYLIHDGDDKRPVAQRSGIPYWGTFVLCQIRLDNPDLLENILNDSPPAQTSPGGPLVSTTSPSGEEAQRQQVASSPVAPESISVLQIPPSSDGVVVSISDGVLTLHVRASILSEHGTVDEASSLRGDVTGLIGLTSPVTLDFSADTSWDEEFLSAFLGQLFRDSPTRYMNSIKCTNIDSSKLDRALA